MLLKGDAKYIVGGRALRQDFTLELKASEATGKVRIGGEMNELISTWSLFKYKRIRCQVFGDWYSCCLSLSFRFVDNHLLIRNLERLLHTKIIIHDQQSPLGSDLQFSLQSLLTSANFQWRSRVNGLSNTRALIFCIGLCALYPITCMLLVTGIIKESPA